LNAGPQPFGALPAEAALVLFVVIPAHLMAALLMIELGQLQGGVGGAAVEAQGTDERVLGVAGPVQRRVALPHVAEGAGAAFIVGVVGGALEFLQGLFVAPLGVQQGAVIVQCRGVVAVGGQRLAVVVFLFLRVALIFIKQRHGVLSHRAVVVMS